MHLGGEVAQHLAPDGSKEEGNIKNEKSYKKALEKAKNYQDIFGKDNFFIEIHNHGISIDGEIYLKISGTYVGGAENIIRARDILFWVF